MFKILLHYTFMLWVALFWGWVLLAFWSFIWNGDVERLDTHFKFIIITFAAMYMHASHVQAFTEYPKISNDPNIMTDKDLFN